jgi:uncharacterized membrane protein YcaP (DUF421 family)
VIQTAALERGVANAAVFVVTVFALHRLTALLCGRSRAFRNFVRGKPRPLIHDGRVIERALELEASLAASCSRGYANSASSGPRT